MEFIEMAEGKWKIMLSAEDMVYYKLELRNIEQPTEETRKAFYRVMDEIRAKSGKQMPQGQLTVEIYESIGGGCEMFVTRSGGKGEPLPRKKNISEGEVRETAYLFESVDNLIAAAGKLSLVGYHGESRAYAMNGGSYYYLIVGERSLDAAVSKNEIGEYAFLSEYGRRTQGAYLLPYIEEHGISIGERDAVAWFAKL